MRKKLAYFFIAITLVVLVIYLFRYRRPLDLENTIPIGVTEVVFLDLRQMEHHVLIDAISNPFKYFGGSGNNEEEERISLNEVIEIPRSLLLFTNTSHFKGGWFSNMIALKDRDKLKRYLFQEGFKALADKNLELFAKGKIIVTISGERALIIYKKGEDIAVHSAIQSILEETDFYKEDMGLFKSIFKSESDITYVNSEEDLVEASFEKGCFEVRGTLRSNLFMEDAYAEHSENSIGFLDVKLNKEHKIFESLISNRTKTKFRAFAKLSMDSIVDRWNGSMVLDLKEVRTEMDTIITYEYDDDFNKIEKKSVQELRVPNGAITLGSDLDLYTYFYAHKTIQIVENDTLFAGIPLYKLYAQKQKNTLLISTKKGDDSDLLKKKSYKLNAYLEINKYLEHPLEFTSIPIKDDYLQLLRDVSVRLTTNDELFIQLRLKEKNRNILGQFIKP